MTDGRELSREQRVLQVARSKAETGADWIEINNAVFGIGGIAAELFPSKEGRAAFLKSPEYAEILKLQESAPEGRVAREVSGKFVVRLPRTVHAALIAEAKAEGVSLNQLVLSKLVLQLRSLVDH